MGVPAAEVLADFVRLRAAIRQAERLRSVAVYSVLVPGEVPDEGHDDIGAGARQPDDADLRVTQAAGDPLDRADAVARVEERRRLDHRLLLVRQAPQDRLGDDRLGCGRSVVAVAEDPAEAERPPAARGAPDGRPERLALAHPPMVDGRVLAQLADVDELVVSLRREPDRALAEQQCALAHGAALDVHDPDRLHERGTICELQGFFLPDGLAARLEPPRRARFPGAD